MSKALKLLIAGVLVVVVVAGVGLWWFFKDDAPQAANAEDAGKAAAALDAASGATPLGDVNGTWTVQSGTGDPNVDDPDGTYVGFRIAEELSGIGSTTAVGRTGQVSGTIEIADDTVATGSFEVDVTAITTNDSRRDGQVQRALATGANPTATFTLTEPLGLDAAALDGGVQQVTATGDLTIAGTTKRVQIPLEAQLVGSVIAVNGSLDLTFSDYGVAVPDSQIVLSVADHGTLELQLLLTKSS